MSILESIVSNGSSGVWRWTHDGEAYALSFPTLEQDLQIATLRARIQAPMGDAFWILSDMPEMLAMLEVCLVEHPEEFVRLDGTRVPWRMLDPNAKRSDPTTGPRAGPLNRPQLQSYAFQTPRGRRVSALERALQEARLFLGSFRQMDLDGGPPSRGESNREAQVAGDGLAEPAAAGRAPAEPGAASVAGFAEAPGRWPAGVP